MGEELSFFSVVFWVKRIGNFLGDVGNRAESENEAAAHKNLLIFHRVCSDKSLIGL